MTEFTEDELRRIAFFMATGSGKTLLLHTHIRQLRHYLTHSVHPEMLANRSTVAANGTTFCSLRLTRV